MEIPSDCQSYFEKKDISDAAREEKVLTNAFQHATTSANISLSKNNKSLVNKSQNQNHKSFKNVFKKIKAFIKNKKKNSIKSIGPTITECNNHCKNDNDPKSQPQPNLKKCNSILSQSSTSKTNQDKINTSFTASIKQDDEIQELEEEDEEIYDNFIESDDDDVDDYEEFYSSSSKENDFQTVENAYDPVLSLKAAKESVATIIHSLKELTLPPSSNYNCAMILLIYAKMDGVDIVIPFYGYLIDSLKAEFIHRFEIENLKNLLDNYENINFKSVYSPKTMILSVESEMLTILTNNNLRCSFEDIQMKVDNYFLWCLTEKSGKHVQNKGTEDSVRALLIYT